MFATAISRALKDINSSSDTVRNTVANVVVLDDNLRSTVTSLDHGAVLAAHDLEDRQFERLLKYQYFVARAYEYRFLTPYSGGLGLDNITRRLRDLIGESRLQTPEAFAPVVAAYKDSVRRVIQDGIDRFNVRPPLRTLRSRSGSNDDEKRQHPKAPLSAPQPILR